MTCSAARPRRSRPRASSASGTTRSSCGSRSRRAYGEGELVLDEEALLAGAEALLTGNPEVEAFLRDMYALADYVATAAPRCREKGWSSYKDKAIVPACLWEEAPINAVARYSTADLPFVAGMVDGLYGEVKGLVLLPKMMYDLSAGVERTVRAYLKTYLLCNNLKLTDAQLEEVIDRRKAAEQVKAKDTALAEGGVGYWTWASEYFTDTQYAAYKDLDCDGAQQLVKEVNEFAAYATEWGTIVAAYDKVAAQLATYFEAVAATDNVARYEHGKIGIQVAATFVPVAGQAGKIAKATRAGEATVAVAKFSRGKVDEVGEAIGRKLAGGGLDALARLKKLGISDEVAEQLTRGRAAGKADELAGFLERTPGLKGAVETVSAANRAKFADDLVGGGAEFNKYISSLEAEKLEDVLIAWEALYPGAKRLDVNVLEFISDPLVVGSRRKVISANLPTRFPSIAIDELTAIYHYTTEAYTTLNAALRSGVLTSSQRGFTSSLNTALNKLPTHSGSSLYRGASGMEAKIVKAWRKGEEIKFNDFKSTSMSLEQARNFSDDVILEILPPGGKSICQISCLPGEAEVLFSSRSRFKVSEVIEDFVVYDSDFNPSVITKVILSEIK